MRQPLLCIILTLAFFVEVKGQSYDPPLNDAQLHLSSEFIGKSGSARLTEYLELEKIILPMPAEAAALAPISSNAIGSHPTTLQEIELMLGTPNSKLEKSIYVYLLDPVSGCSAVIGFDVNELVNFKTSKNCP